MPLNVLLVAVKFKNIQMKYFAAALLLIVWMAATFLLAITIIGIIVIVDEDSAWMKFPEKLLAVFG